VHPYGSNLIHNNLWSTVKFFSSSGVTLLNYVKEINLGVIISLGATATRVVRYNGESGFQ
jgi:hypothetical protein